MQSYLFATLHFMCQFTSLQGGWTGWEQLNSWVSFKIAQSPRFLSAFMLKCKNGHQRVQLLWGGRRWKVSCLGNQQGHQQSVTQTVTFGETGRLWLNKAISWHDDDGPQCRPRVTMLWAKAEIWDCPLLFSFYDAQNRVIIANNIWLSSCYDGPQWFKKNGSKTKNHWNPWKVQQHVRQLPFYNSRKQWCIIALM